MSTSPLTTSPPRPSFFRTRLLTFRWSRTADEVRETHRQAAGTLAWSPGVLSGDQAGDYAEYRGKHRDGVVHGPALSRDWKAQPPPLVWRQPLGGGHAGFAIAGNAVVTIEQRRDAEAVVCYATDTGQEVWQFAYPALAGGRAYLRNDQEMACYDLTAPPAARTEE